MTDVDALSKDGNIPNKPGVTNWVEEAGGLPPYIKQVAEDLHSERGMSVSAAIATAVNKIKQWSRGGGDVKPSTQAKATAALAQWSEMKKAADLSDEEVYETLSKGLNYMEKPHRFTPGPAGMCLFCSNSQRWHTENRPKTPAEVEQEKKDRSIQEKNDNLLGTALMLTPLPTEDDMLAGKVEEQKRVATAERIAGGPVQDPNDPKVAAGVYKKALTQALAAALVRKAEVKHTGPDKAGRKPGDPNYGADPEPGKKVKKKPASSSSGEFNSLHPRAKVGSPTGGQFIKVGSSGESTEAVQRAVNKYSDGDDLGEALKVDGKYGPKTAAAVAEYQKQNGLMVDGIVGPQTLASLKDKIAGGTGKGFNAQGKRAGTPKKTKQPYYGGRSRYGKAVETDPDAKENEELLALLESVDLEQEGAWDEEIEGEGEGADSADRPLVEVQYDPEKKSGGIGEDERKKLADEGVAMEDGTFPVRNEADLKSALQLWGKASDPHAAREHIIVRAVELGLEDSLPQNFKDHQASKKVAEGADPTQGGDAPAGPVKKAAYAVTKTADEKRYTLGPMYIPNRLDAHNEFTTADELQKAVWDYVRAGNRDIRLQHNLDIIAGECVEVLSWPTEITSHLALPGGGMQKSKEVTFPAGTTYMGIIWEPWAWNWVKKGKISGLSMGGFAKRVAVEFDMDDSLTKSLDEAISKYAPDQKRDRAGRWAGNGATSVTLAQGTAAHNLISGRSKWAGPFDTKTGKATPYNPDKIWQELSGPEKSAIGKLLTRLGVEWNALVETINSNDGTVGQRPSYNPRRDRWQSDGLKAVGKQFGVEVEFLSQALAKHGQKGTPNYPHRGNGRGFNLAGGKANTLTEIDADADYAAHVTRVQGLLDGYALAGGSKNPLESKNSTHLANRTDPDDPKSDYLLARRKQQAAIIGSMLGDAVARSVPRQAKSWIAGGLPGAGKSSYINSEDGQKRLGLVAEKTSHNLDGFKNALVINPDQIKALMIESGMAPEIPGTDPMERVGFLHEESSEIASMLADRAMADKINIVWDITAHSASSVADRIADLRDEGYNDTTYFLLDVTLDHSVDSAKKRHRRGVARIRSGQDGDSLEEKASLGGRYVPEFVTRSNASQKGNRSKMRDAYEEIVAGTAMAKEVKSRNGTVIRPAKRIGHPYRVILIDNEGYKKKLISDQVFSMSSSISR